MTERTYTFDLVCPRCGKESMTTGTTMDPPPVVNCGDCLMNDVEVVEFKIIRVMVSCLLAFALLLTTDARAQQDRTVYGADGRVQQRVHTDSAGAATVYGADGRVQGRTSTSSTGTTAVYGADGRTTGTISPPRGK